MRLVRTTEEGGAGKYRVARSDTGAELPDGDFFVLRLQDRHAPAALLAYANELMKAGDHDFAADIVQLATRALHHPTRKDPD